MSSSSTSPRTDIGNTESVTRGPAPMIEGPLQQAIGGATSVFGGGPEGYATGQGRNMLGQTLRGDYLTPGTNPFLQGQINQLGDQLYQQTASRFGQAGRNVGGSGAAQAFEDSLARASVPLAAQNYQAERDRQMSGLGMTSRFDPLDQYLNRLGLLSGLAGNTMSRRVDQSTRDVASPWSRGTDVLGTLFDIFGSSGGFDFGANEGTLIDSPVITQTVPMTDPESESNPITSA